MKFAFLTDRIRPQGTADDQLAAAALRARGASVDFVPWESAEGDYDCWLVRSPWNYHHHVGEFLDTMSRLECVVNPPSLLRWNADKSYLVELAARGVPVIPTRTCTRDALDLGDWDEVVVKPTVSAAGDGTYRLRRDMIHADTCGRLPGGRLLVQPFLPEVLSAGEVSVVLVNGEVTHAVKKTGAPGNFLVHEEHGGRVETWDVSPRISGLSHDALAAAPSAPLYARADWIETAEGPLLVELELVEPELFFRFCPAAAARFAEACIAELRR